MRRVVVTGLGVVAPNGHTRPAYWEALAAGRSGIKPFDTIDDLPAPIACGARVEGLDPAAHLDPQRLGTVDRFGHLGLIAAQEAVTDSGLDFRAPALADRSGVIVGADGGYIALEESYRGIFKEGKRRAHPLTVPKIMPNAVSSNISMVHGCRGPNYTIATACASATHAIGQAFQMIRSGMTDAMVTGGAEAMIAYGVLRAWAALKITAPDTCRPFSANRKGMVLGEGAAMLVLETLEQAQARGATIYAEMLGLGMTADAADLLAPSQDGAARAIRGALADGGLAPEAVGYVNAHGTGTRANDITETAAIRQVFGAHADRLMVSSTKSMHGHPLGAAGALEAAATLMALKDGVVPPTANLDAADPQCDLDYVPNTARRADIGVALSNSFAFGGLNAVIAMGRLDR